MVLKSKSKHKKCTRQVSWLSGHRYLLAFPNCKYPIQWQVLLEQA